MEDLVTQGMRAFYDGDRIKARKKFTEAANQDSNNARAWDCLYSLAENDKERARCLNQLLRINPQDTQAQNRLHELKVNSTLGFLNLGFKDYLAARVLLNSGLLLQGATLASTSVEKYFKAVLAIHGDYSHGHLNVEQLNAIKAIEPKLYSSLNKSFLLFLQKCYQLRYFDTLGRGFTLAIIQRPTLAELDYSMSEIRKGFKLQRGDKKVVTAYDKALEDHEESLFLNNYILGDGDKGSFLLKEDNLVYAMRLDDTVGLVEVDYVAEKGLHDGNFLIDGLTPRPGKK